MLPRDVIFIFLYRFVVVMEYLIRFSHYLELRGEDEEEVYDFLRKCSEVMLMTAQANELLTRALQLRVTFSLRTLFRQNDNRMNLLII